MNKIDDIKEQYIQFIRNNLPDIRKAVPEIKRTRSFYARAHQTKKGRYQFVEKDELNWWQLPKKLNTALYDTHNGKELVKLFEKTHPFSEIVNKQIVIPDIGMHIPAKLNSHSGPM